MNSNPNSLRYVLTILFARKGLILTMTTLVLGTVVIGTFLIPPTYESSIKILLRRERSETVLSAEEQPTQPYVPYEVSETELNSEVEILTSRPLLEKVVRGLELDEPSSGQRISLSGWLDQLYRQLHTQKPLRQVDRTVQALQDDLEITPIKKSSVVQITYRASDPEVAANVLNTLAEFYIDAHLQLRQTAEAAEFYDEQANTTAQKLHETENTLKQFELERGITSIPEQETQTLQRLADFQAQLNATQVDIQASKERIAVLEQLLAAQPERITKETRTKYNEGLDLLRNRLGELELRQAELKQKYQPGSRMVEQIEAQVSTVKEYLKSVENRPPREVTEGQNQLYMQLQDDLLRARAEMAAQQERAMALQKVVESYRGTLRSFRESSYQQRGLQRMRDATEQAYMTYVKKAEEARAAQALDERRIVNVSIAQRATPNYKPVSPNRSLNLLLGLCVGLLSSVATAFSLEYIDRPVRTEDMLQHVLSLNVLAALPEEKN